MLSLTESGANQPNIIFIMADDLGNADFGYDGGQVKSVFDPDYDIDDSGLPREKSVLPQK